MSHQPDYTWSLQPGVNVICPVWPNTEEEKKVLEFKKGQWLLVLTEAQGQVLLAYQWKKTQPV